MPRPFSYRAFPNASRGEVRLYSEFVPYQMICPQCEQIGFVRMERVITGVYSARAYECGRCLHTWQVTETGQAPEAPKHTPRPKPRTRRLGPHSK
jgi:hypothetical protein